MTLSKNGNSSERHAQSKKWYFVMYPSWKQCRSRVKVMSNFGSLWLVHDFSRHFLDGYMTKDHFFDWAWRSPDFRFYWEWPMDLSLDFCMIGQSNLSHKTGFSSKYSQVWLGRDGSTTITRIPFLLSVPADRDTSAAIVREWNIWYSYNSMSYETYLAYRIPRLKLKVSWTERW